MDQRQDRALNHTNQKRNTIMKQTPVKNTPILKMLALSLCLGALAMAGGLAGCAGDRYTQSTGERIDDKGDSSRVRKALSADTQYKYNDVNVQTFKGVVQLSGFVNSRDQKNRAADLAQKVQGVHEVKNNITVKESAN